MHKKKMVPKIPIWRYAWKNSGENLPTSMDPLNWDFSMFYFKKNSHIIMVSSSQKNLKKKKDTKPNSWIESLSLET